MPDGTILVLEPIHPLALQRLRGAATVEETDTRISTLNAPERDVVALVTRGLGQIDPATLDRFPNLRVVARCGVGLDNVDVAAAVDRGITVIFAPGRTTTAVAEHALGLMLALAHDIYRLASALRRGDWEARHETLGRDLRGRRVGIVGLGSIGTRAAELCQAIGMRVVYWSQHSRDSRFERVELDPLLGEADVVSLHLSLNAETRGFLGADRLRAMKRGALLVNTARGALVDKSALVGCLDRGWLAGYGADCLDPEPPEPDDPLVSHPRTLITPHSAVMTEETFESICVTACSSVGEVLTGRAPDPTTVWRPG